MALPNINQVSQGMNVQAPKVPSGQQYAQGVTQGRSGLPARPVANMAPDNGQHGGAQRYMTPQSGAMAVSNQRNTNPYGGAQTAYYGKSQPLPPIQGQLSPMPIQTPQATQQSNATYRQALQDRMMGVRNNPMPNRMPQTMPQMGMMPQMFANRNY